MPLTTNARCAIETALARNPGAVIEYIAKDHDVSPAEVIACLPESQVTTIGGENFEMVMYEISSWGEITFLVHTDDLILEAKGSVPKGKSERGFYNLHGKPIGGHLKADNCSGISFVSRPLFGTDTHSVQFFNKSGGCMFKIYLGRNADRRMFPDQIVKFLTFRERMAMR